MMADRAFFVDLGTIELTHEAAPLMPFFPKLLAQQASLQVLFYVYVFGLSVCASCF